MKCLSCFLFLVLINFTVLSQDDYYWVGGSGNWSDINHWQLENGTTPFVLPNETNSVIFNENSFVEEGDYIDIDNMNVFCNDMIWENIPFDVWLTGNDETNVLFISGSLTFHENIINDFQGSIHFIATEPGSKTIDPKGVSFNNDVRFNGILCDFSLIGDLFMNNSALVENHGNIFLEHGTLITNGQEIHCTSFISNYTNERGLNMQNSIIKLYAQGVMNCWDVNHENLSLQAQGSSIILHEAEAKFVTSNGINHQYGNIHLNGFLNKVENNGQVYFDKIQVDGDNCELGSNIIVDSLIINGDNCSFIGEIEIFNLIVNSDYFTMPEGLYLKRLISYGPFTLIGPNYIEFGEFLNNVYFYGNNTFDTLILNPCHEYNGSTIYFQAGTTTTANDSLYLRGNQCCNVSIESTSFTELAFLRMDYGDYDVYCDFLNIFNVGAQSETLSFYAGAYSTALPNPDDPPPGWIFENDTNYFFGFQGEIYEGCWGTPVILNANCFNGDPTTQYFWNGSSIPGEITFEVTEPDTVTILVLYAPECYITDYAVVVFDSCENSVPNNFYNSPFKIFPNPSNGILNLEITKKVDEFELTVYNSMGIALIRETIRPMNETTKNTYDFSHLEPGVYYFRVEFKDKVLVNKIIIY